MTVTTSALFLFAACTNPSTQPSAVESQPTTLPVSVIDSVSNPETAREPSPTPFNPAVFTALNPITSKQVIEDDLYPYHTKGLFNRDSIRPVYAPVFLEVEEADFVPDELVIGVSFNGETRAYPIGMLRVREMVHDEVGGVPILVTW